MSTPARAAPPSRCLPKEDATEADHTAISFKANDIGAALAGLRKPAWCLEDFDLPGLKTLNQFGVLGSEKAAWFKDAAGIYLCIHEDVA